MRRLPLLLLALVAVPAALADDLSDRYSIHSLAFRGSVLHQNQPASGAPAPEINWWVIGGIAVGAAIVINNDNKDKNDAPATKRGGS